MIFEQLTIAYGNGIIEHINGVIVHNNEVNCPRCGQVYKERKCSSCSEFGPVDPSTKFYQLPYQCYQIKRTYIKIDVQLTALQTKASSFICANCLEKEILIWAVCGSGKTEITFEIIRRNLNQGNFVAFVIPRKDLLNEIPNRLEEVFVGVDIVKLSSEHKKKRDGQLYVLTPNQLLRFKNAFSLVICDEVDAYPFMEDPRFIYGVESSRREECATIFLTSTPSQEFLTRDLVVFTIYERWHQFELPVPELIYQNRKLFKFRILNKSLKQCINNERQLLLFVGQIGFGHQVQRKLEKWGYECKFVYAQDEKRAQKVEEFRSGRLPILITTTILERGVTFKGIDVIVLDSDCFTYNVAALVQIAGRVNRKIDDQSGIVIFCFEHLTKTIEIAIEQIKEMNDKRSQ